MTNEVKETGKEPTQAVGSLLTKKFKDERTHRIIMKVELKRDAEGLEIYVMVAEELEDYIRTQSKIEAQQAQSNTEYIQASSRWNNGEPKQFYRKISEGEVGKWFMLRFDDYGQGFFSIGQAPDGTTVKRPNIAILRTVGLSQGQRFKMNSVYSDETLRKVIVELYKETAQFYKLFIRPCEIQAELSVLDTI